MKSKVTKEMIDDLNSLRGIDVVQELEDILMDELDKATIKVKVDKRNGVIDDLLDEGKTKD